MSPEDMDSRFAIVVGMGLAALVNLLGCLRGS
jgi:hypothetical protein